MPNNVIEKNPGPKLRARAIIGQRLRDFGMLTICMNASDADQVLDWIESQEFLATCKRAEVDAAKVAAKFHELVRKGNQSNVDFIEYEAS